MYTVLTFIVEFTESFIIGTLVFSGWAVLYPFFYDKVHYKHLSTAVLQLSDSLFSLPSEKIGQWPLENLLKMNE